LGKTKNAGKAIIESNTPLPPVSAGAIQELPVRVASPRQKTLRRFLRHRLAVIGLVVFIILVLLSVLAPLLTNLAPDAVDLRARSQGPSGQHWFGTDSIGRDTFSRTIYGGRISILVGLAAVAISARIGAILGALAGFSGGLVETLIMRFTDIIMAFPAIIIILVVAAMIGPGLINTILLIGLLNWPVPCRLVRSRFLSLREQEFMVAARAIGVTRQNQIVRHLLPNSLDVLIVFSSLGIANAILLEAGLSFLGLGIQPPTPSWGNMLNVASNVSIMEDYPWQWMPAGLAIILTVLAINFIGDGLRDALDPRMKI
jgi:peptide/nickel transport system permease protein